MTQNNDTQLESVLKGNLNYGLSSEESDENLSSVQRRNKPLLNLEFPGSMKTEFVKYKRVKLSELADISGGPKEKDMKVIELLRRDLQNYEEM